MFLYLKSKGYNKTLSVEYEGGKNPIIAIYNSYYNLKKDVTSL